MWENELIRQLLEAPFPQMMLTSAAMLLISYVLLRLTGLKDPRIRGAFFALTLIAPIVVYLIYTPSIWMARPLLEHGFSEGASFVISQAAPASGVIINIVEGTSEFSAKIVEKAPEVSYTGLLCIIGLVFGAAVLAVSYIFGVRIVKRCQGVIDVTAEDEPRLYRAVDKLAQRIGVPTPKIGITESLQPNAFTIGYGKNTMVVFSSGLLAGLLQVEVEAVIAHELAHIRNRDFHLMAVVSALRVAAFFNPAAYLSASMFSREREYLADAVGSKATGRRNTLKRALIKIAKMPAPGKREAIPELLSGLFIYSQIGSIRAAFTSHPSLDMRLDRIGVGPVGTSMDKYKALLVALLLVGAMTLIGSYIMHPQWLLNPFIGFGPPLRTAMGGAMLHSDWGSYGMLTYTTGPTDGVIMRAGPDTIVQLVVPP